MAAKQPEKNATGKNTPGVATADGALRQRSGYPGMIWPPIPDAKDARLLALAAQFEDSQWWDGEDVLALQLRQLEPLIAHAARTSPFYQTRLQALAGLKRGELGLDSWRQTPHLTRADIQQAGEGLFSQSVPKKHGRLSETSTSGSTGEPVRVKGTELTRMFFRALNLRYHIWHGRDFAGKTANLHRLKNPDRPPRPSQWVAGHISGPMVHFDIRKPVAEQAAWLIGQKAEYVLTHPTNLAALLDHCEAEGLIPEGLQSVATMGEVVFPELRERCRQVWGVPLIDAYSAFEVGLIAIQCPDHAHYHVQSESLLVEIVDDAGNPCGSGEIGRVLVTDLHNFATPLIRYEIGDYAEVGAACPCGRGLPVINRILGRSRNRLTLPDGTPYWPVFSDVIVEALAKPMPSMVQAQVVQISKDEIEVRVVCDRAVTVAEQDRAHAALTRIISDQFTYTFVYLDELPEGRSHKFEAVKNEYGG